MSKLILKLAIIMREMLIVILTPVVPLAASNVIDKQKEQRFVTNLNDCVISDLHGRKRNDDDAVIL